MNFSSLFGQMLFGTIGFFAFVYGKKQGLWKTMVIGVVLIVFPYVVSNGWLLYLIGIGLTVSLFVFRD